MMSNHAIASPSPGEAKLAQRNSGRGFFRTGNHDPEFTWLEKIDISRIFIQRFAGAPAKARLSSLDAASAVLDGWARGVPDSGHEQCAFEIVFENGCRYHGRFDLTKSKKHVSLSRYVRKQLATLAVMSGENSPLQGSGETEAGSMSASLAESARTMLRYYNI